MNASSALVPTINVCACQNGGLCIQQATTAEIQVLSFSQHTVLGCECVLGFTGDFCEIVRDFCLFQSGSPCHPLVNCTNSPTNYICGHCPPGYSGEGTDCAGRILAVSGWFILHLNLSSFFLQPSLFN